MNNASAKDEGKIEKNGLCSIQFLRGSIAEPQSLPVSGLQTIALQMNVILVPLRCNPYNVMSLSNTRDFSIMCGVVGTVRGRLRAGCWLEFVMDSLHVAIVCVQAVLKMFESFSNRKCYDEWLSPYMESLTFTCQRFYIKPLV